MLNKNSLLEAEQEKEIEKEKDSDGDYRTIESQISTMSGARKHVPLVVLLLLLALLKRGDASFPAAAPLQDTDPVNGAVALPDDDYYEDNLPTGSTTPPDTVPSSSVGPCDYDFCREPQTPCSELAKTRCSCPGISWDDVPPEPPMQMELSLSGSDLVVHWCAPHSYVTAYRVTVGGRERQPLGVSRRSYALGRVDSETWVCVVAVNNAGASNGTCKTYRPEGGGGLSLRAGIIGGALGFLLLFSLAVLLWRHRARRRTEARVSTQEEPVDTPLENRATEQGEA